MFLFACEQVQAAAAQLGEPRVRAEEPDEAEGVWSRACSDHTGGGGQEPQPVPDRVWETAEEAGGRFSLITLSSAWCYHCCLSVLFLFHNSKWKLFNLFFIFLLAQRVKKIIIFFYKEFEEIKPEERSCDPPSWIYPRPNPVFDSP